MPHSIADDFKSIPMSSNLGESLERAHRFAREQTHRLVTLEHLLLALTEDQEAALILQAANVDLGRLRADVSGYLGRLLEDMRAEPGSEPKPDPELLRVLQAAASAAQQSKRRQIDGAIVLAAVVGDGKSPAAGTLKAHGMTFEEAIRALQRANTQARLKTPAKAATAKSPEPVPVQEAPKPVEPAASIEVPVAAAVGESSSLSARLATQTDTADHILAAARARIQQRASVASAALKGGEAPKPPVAAAAQEPQTPTNEPVQAKETGAPAGSKEGGNSFEDLLAVSTAAKAEPAHGAYPLPPDAAAEAAARAPRQEWAPPDMRPPGPRQPPAAPRASLPSQGPRPDEGPRQQQPPQRGAARPGPAPGQGGLGGPGRQARAPRHEPAGMNGSHPGGLKPGAPLQPRPGAPRGAQGDRGPLVESVPRRMRVGTTSKAEVRIARDRIEGLVAALNGHSMPHRPDQIAARALSVRLKAPNGGFLIESISPETQWVEGPSGLGHDDYAIWRWTVTPQRRGRGRLLLMVSARTVGQDGLAAESAPPDRLIDVRVAPNRGRGFGRMVAWLMALGVGLALGKFTDQLWEAGAALLGKMLAGS
jgi:neural Wiskott-Aldrich syndrome protein